MAYFHFGRKVRPIPFLIAAALRTDKLANARCYFLDLNRHRIFKLGAVVARHPHTKALGVSAEELKRLVAQHGNSAAKIRQALGK